MSRNVYTEMITITFVCTLFEEWVWHVYNTKIK